MKFEITEEMKVKINEWDTCNAVDPTGAKFAYTFIPTGLGIVTFDHFDICNRKMILLKVGDNSILTF